MGRKRRGNAGTTDADPHSLQEGEWATSTGTVRLERDHHAPNAWTVYVGGVPSSHVDLDSPQELAFEYMRWMAAVIAEGFPTGRGPAPHLRVLHLGGGACSMALWVHARFPDARQVVVELDGKLVELVRGWFDLPSAPLLRVRTGDAREILPSLREDTRDVIIRDVFAGSTTPEALTTVAYAQEAARVLESGGLYLLNVGDGPDRVNVRREAENLRQVFTHVAAIADPAMFKGRRRGNTVLVASDRELPLTPALTRTLLSDPLPAKVDPHP
ncbi:spermidine synthase [Brevibacterium litoralis]|uniref:spermidine synthase n=1 Tax=Brevibacterium litoralis TaxID=3138935 RepID=UPI0032F03681